VYINKNDKEFMNWAWGNDVLGWLSFNCRNQSVCGNSNYKVMLSGSKPRATNLSIDKDNPTDYCFVTSYAPIRSRWVFLSDTPGASQSAYRVEIYQGANLVDRSCDPNLSNPASRCLSGSQSYLSTKLAYNKTYFWKLTVWDNNDNQSDLTSGPDFTTIPHPYPLPDFEWSPVRPAAKEIIQMKDLTAFYDNNPSERNWAWDFGDGAQSDLSDPDHSYDNPNLAGYKLTLDVIDGDNYGPCSLSKNISITFPAPEWQEAPPPTE
jgi:PKD repeat protein